MSRAFRSYTDSTAPAPARAGFDASTPVEGFYRFRLHGGAVWGVVKVWYGPPHDPVTGEELDRSWRWQALFNGEPIDVERVWPVCAKHPSTERDYRLACKRQDWAKEHAPDSAYADPRARHDLLSTPLPF
ncbi:hypothetical protein [Croceibacterium aestuarii]|uniref:hypothetical protein n=1 Tax=Croceibacterium aestuarii TaxID=3064139 RepID=UPI00272E4EEE|nr:hypothetical protein [Croceibacterium sp. D39]